MAVIVGIDGRWYVPGHLPMLASDLSGRWSAALLFE
jgi:hypothetical protein